MSGNGEGFSEELSALKKIRQLTFYNYLLKCEIIEK